MNVTVQFTLAFAVYTNVYIFPFVVSLTVALLNVTWALLNVTAPLVRLVVLIHAHVDVHVNDTLPVCPLFSDVFVGCVLTVQYGFIVSIFSILLLPLYIVFHTASTALKHTYFPLSLSLLNVNVLHAV